MELTRKPRLLGFAAAVLAAALFFMPYISATKEYAERLEEISKLSPDEKVAESADMKVSDLKNLSVYDYAKIYIQAGEEIFGSKTSGYIEGAFFAAVGVFAVLAALCALGRKPVLMFLMTALMGASFYAINWDITDRGIMPDPDRVWGLSYYAYWPVAAVMAVCAVWLFIAKRKEKKGMGK